jgi:hypothetical protein
LADGDVGLARCCSIGIGDTNIARARRGATDLIDAVTSSEYDDAIALLGQQPAANSRLRSAVTQPPAAQVISPG